jgi:ankyrin repeat protein
MDTDAGRLAVLKAVKSGDIAQVRAAIESGADPELRNPLGWSARCWQNATRRSADDSTRRARLKLIALLSALVARGML